MARQAVYTHGASAPFNAGDVVYYEDKPFTVQYCTRINRFMEWRASIEHKLTGFIIDLPCSALTPIANKLQCLNGGQA